MSTAEGPATVTLTDDEKATVLYEAGDGPGMILATVERIVAARVVALTADLAAARAAVHAVLRTASRPTRDSATAQVNAAALDRLRALLPAAPTGKGLHACRSCGIELDADDARDRCEDCAR